MLVAVLIYFLVGAVVALYVAGRRDQPREKEVGDWMILVSGSPFTFLLGFILWPLWLLFMCFPQESFIEKKSPTPDAVPDYIGKFAEVVIPLTPVGRVSIDGVHREARAESGIISEGTQVLICSRSVGDELIVRKAIPES